jgi:hypothetical protein
VTKLVEDHFAKTPKDKAKSEKILYPTGPLGLCAPPSGNGTRRSDYGKLKRGEIANMTDQIRYLQARAPFETFSIELANGHVLQIHVRHLVATTDGSRPGEAVIGVLLTRGAFEVVNASQVTSVSVGLHPKVKQQLANRMEWAKKTFGGEGKEA